MNAKLMLVLMTTSVLSLVAVVEQPKHYGVPQTQVDVSTKLCEKFPALIDTAIDKYTAKTGKKIDKITGNSGKEMAAKMGCNLIVASFLPKTQKLDDDGKPVLNKAGKPIYEVYPLDVCAGSLFDKMIAKGGLQATVGKMLKDMWGSTAMMACASFMQEKGIIDAEDGMDFMVWASSLTDPA